MKISPSSIRTLLGVSIGIAALGTGASAQFELSPAASSSVPFPAYGHIVLVVEENQQELTIIGNRSAPYTNSLARNGALLTNSYGTEHPSQPNYLDIFSGSDQNVYDDNPVPGNPFSGQNLGAELLHADLSFAGFSEDLPYTGDTVDQFAAAPGDPPGTHDYARKHNPWANWQNDNFPASETNPGSNYLPSTVNLTMDPFKEIAATGDYSLLPTVSIIVPNQQHDDHGVAGGASGSQLIANGDTWLKNNLSAYAAWAKKNNSLLIVTWDEDDYSATNKVPTIFYGAHIRPGRYAESGITSYTSLINGDTEPSGPPAYVPIEGVNHWNLLRTIEDIYRLPHAGASSTSRPITDIFTR